MDPLQALSAVQQGGARSLSPVGRVDSLRAPHEIEQSVLHGELKRSMLVDAPSEGPNFNQLLSDAMDHIVSSHRTSEQAILDVAAGKRDDIAAVMIQMHKSSLSLTMGLEVRNRVVDAYHEIMRMSV